MSLAIGGRECCTTARRAASVTAQLDGKSEGTILEDSGRNPYGGPGVRLAALFQAAIDSDGDARITQEEFTDTFNQWFAAWDKDQSGKLTDEQLKRGVMRDLFHIRPRTREFSVPQRIGE